MDSLRLMGFCVILLVPIIVVKKKVPEYGLLLTLAGALFVVFRCISMTAPLIATMEELVLRSGLDGLHIGILLRTVAVSLVSHLCAGLCRDGGSQTLAAVVEMTGAVAVLVIGLPLLESVVELLLKFIG